jgi:hypothetical protein
VLNPRDPGRAVWQYPKLKTPSFAEAVMSPTPEEKKARERVDAKKRRSKKPTRNPRRERRRRRRKPSKFANPLIILDEI